MSLIPLEINGTREASAIANDIPAKTTIENSNIHRLIVTLEPCLGANGPVDGSGSDTYGFLGLRVGRFLFRRTNRKTNGSAFWYSLTYACDRTGRTWLVPTNRHGLVVFHSMDLRTMHYTPKYASLLSHF